MWVDSLDENVPEGYRVSWKPTPKQTEFLSAAEYEVLFGGAAGGGKTDALLIDALGLSQQGFNNPDYQAIIFRRTFPDLKDIIDRSMVVYKDFCPGARYDKQAHVWTFPGGGKVEFGFIQRDVERFRYRGRAFCYIGWEELTLWPTSKPYMYLQSRCRVAVGSGLTTYIRATSNPDGPGFKWVKDYFGINSTGEAVTKEIEVTDTVTGKTYRRCRRFIPSRVEDNPHIGEDYLITLSQLDEDERKALREGLWLPPKLKGAFYAEQMHTARKEGRIMKVPHKEGVPCYSFWDLGVSKDGTTALWVGQPVAMQWRWLQCYENYGQSLSHYVKWLRDLPYTYAVHYVPHDASHQRLGKDAVESWEKMLRDLMPGQKIEVVERVPSVDIGIDQTRNKLGECVWDEEGCAEGIAALENHRRIWDEEQQVYRNTPLHDWTSNYSDAFRQWGQVENLDGPAKKFDRKKHRTNARTA